MEKKYKLTETTKEAPNGETLYQIQALKDFTLINGKEIKKGDLGGWVNSEDRLSQEGNCWVYDECMMYEFSYRSRDSIGYENSQQSGFSWQFDNSQQFGNSQQYENSQQYGYSQQYDNSQQYENSQQYDNSVQYGYSQQFGNSQQCGFSQQFGHGRQAGDGYLIPNTTLTHNDPFKERVMLVRDNPSDNWLPRVVFTIKNGKAFAWQATNIEEAKLAEEISSWVLFKELDQETK